MFKNKVLKHHIQKSIIKVLISKRIVRFSDLRPPKTDTNLFSYHLKALIKEGWVEKIEAGYTLSVKGLEYVDRMNDQELNFRMQPKIITMLLIQNSEGDVLVQKRLKQPFINTWTLPYGKTLIQDESIEFGAKRVALQSLNYLPEAIRHAGDAYIRVKTSEEIFSATFVHIFRFETDDIVESETLHWVQPLKLPRLALAPAVEEIVARCFFGDNHFFAEFTQDWIS
jgi:ADP-ribose pyrophosphatase YjhB (NUDIX family)